MFVAYPLTTLLLQVAVAVLHAGAAVAVLVDLELQQIYL
jgi:hypothetical protein